MIKVATIIGARPQFIKAATVSRVIANYPEIKEIIIHTGQHYDKNMSEIFFTELNIPLPDYNLEVGSGTHGQQTGLMLERIEKVLLEEKPDIVLVYGDTNSTIAGALAAVKLKIKVAHVEAGLRSFNKNMPEEINRIATDHISDILFAPTQNAVNLLKKEGLADKTFFSGDVMYDSILYYAPIAEDKYKLNEIINYDKYYLATIHRQENTDDLNRLKSIFEAFSELDLPVIIPLHPRTRKYITDFKISNNIQIIEPVGYLEMILLLKNCEKVLTDSGGLQKEAFFMKKKCLTLREETEWIETLENDWNVVVGIDKDKILKNIKINPKSEQKAYFGNGKAAEEIVKYIKDNLDKKN